MRTLPWGPRCRPPGGLDHPIAADCERDPPDHLAMEVGQFRVAAQGAKCACMASWGHSGRFLLG
eukprot:1430004-Prorocentrum_lima.AAC.1